MYFVRIVEGLNFKQLFSLAGWFLKHPLFMICTVRATILTFKISQREFPNIHGLHNKANAFRHALWNVLIAKSCCKLDKDLKNVLNWTKEITDWHEEFSPNEELMKAMDLHNNKIGRFFFSDNQKKGLQDLVNQLLLKLNEAKKISTVSEITTLNNYLIYIED